MQYLLKDAGLAKDAHSSESSGTWGRLYLFLYLFVCLFIDRKSTEAWSWNPMQERKLCLQLIDHITDSF